MPQQIYAKIKKSSKYYDQNSYAQGNTSRWGWPFLVNIISGGPTAYVVIGGPGGRYRLADVNLFIIDDDGIEMRIR